MSKHLVFVVVPVLVSSLVGCVIAGSVGEFRLNGLRKASFDMQCPPEQIEVVEIQQGSVGTQGCGHRARYEYIPGAGTWVLNGADRK